MAATKSLPINAKSAESAETIARKAFASMAPEGTTIASLTLTSTEALRPAAEAAATERGATGCYVFAVEIAKVSEPSLSIGLTDAWDSIVEEAKATRSAAGLSQMAAVLVLIEDRAQRGIVTHDEALEMIAYLEPGLAKSDRLAAEKWLARNPHPSVAPIATQTPKETPMTAKTATPKTAKTATPKATVTPKADPVAAAVTKVCGAHTRTPDAYCGKDLPLADFNKGSDKDGLDRLCKACSAAWWAASKARSAAKKADATPKAKATTAKAEATPKAPKAPKAAATPKRDPGARPAVADEADAKRAAADAARLARVKAAVAAAALAENAAA